MDSEFTVFDAAPAPTVRSAHSRNLGMKVHRTVVGMVCLLPKHCHSVQDMVGWSTFYLFPPLHCGHLGISETPDEKYQHNFESCMTLKKDKLSWIEISLPAFSDRGDKMVVLCFPRGFLMIAEVKDFSLHLQMMAHVTSWV